MHFTTLLVMVLLHPTHDKVMVYLKKCMLIESIKMPWLKIKISWGFYYIFQGIGIALLKEFKMDDYIMEILNYFTKMIY